MSRTIRKDREDIKYIEGNPKGEDLHTYKCRCSYCTNSKTKDKKRLTFKEITDQIIDIGI